MYLCWRMDLQRALYLILMSEKFQQLRIEILPATDFTVNGRVVNFVFICSSQNWLIPSKMIGRFRNWNIGQSGFLVGHVRCPTFISTTEEGVHWSVIEHGMMSLTFQTAVQKNEAKLSSFVQFENEMASPCFTTEQCTTFYVLTVLEPSHIQSGVIAGTVLW